MRFEDLETPCLLLDEERMLANVERVRTRARSLGLRIRPHVKTPKCLEIVARMVDDPAYGLTVSTVREAEVFARYGYKDLLLTTPLAPAKLPRVRALVSAGVRFTCVVDSADAVRAIDAAATRAGTRVEALIELTVDGFRGGVRPGSADYDELVNCLARAEGVSTRGVMVYPGSSSTVRSDAGRAALARSHKAAALVAAGSLRACGQSDEVRSFGSTSVMMSAEDLDGLTEHRGGIYAFQDLQQVGLGWCSRDDIALTVAATIVAHDRQRNRLTIDAGALALSKDRAIPGSDADVGYGVVVDTRDHKPIGDLYVSTVFQEHGLVTSPTDVPIDFSVVPIGRVVAIQPYHADLTAAAFPAYHVLRSGKPEEIWERHNGW